MNKPINTQVPPYQLNEVKPHSFIFEIENALTTDICQEIIERFEANPELADPVFCVLSANYAWHRKIWQNIMLPIIRMEQLVATEV